LPACLDSKTKHGGIPVWSSAFRRPLAGKPPDRVNAELQTLAVGLCLIALLFFHQPFHRGFSSVK
jgi:hypothetical protein